MLNFFLQMASRQLTLLSLVLAAFPRAGGVAKILNSASWRYVAKLPQLYCLGVKMSAKDCFYE
jgi:hypothetical protein